jgi:hypothetical protein
MTKTEKIKTYLKPLSPTTVSYPSGKDIIKS